MSALEIGVSGVSLSGTGSAYTALVGRDQIKELKSCWSDMGGSVIQTRIVNKVWLKKNFLQKPARIYVILYCYVI